MATMTRSLPPFMRRRRRATSASSRPLVVGGQVVAVLYADGAEVAAGPSGSGDRVERHAAWADEVELITRHARGAAWKM